MGRLIDYTGQRGCIDMGITIQSSLAEVIATHKRRRHRVENLNKMEAGIDAIKTKGLTHERDVVLWKGKGDRYKTKFSTNETWDAIREARPCMEWCEGIWFLHATPKHSFISWLAIKNRLATGDRMLTWQNGVDPSCVFCTQQIEDRDHLFFKCCYAEEIWSGLSRKILGQKFTTSWSDVLRILTFQLAIYSIWRERNSRRHGETPIPPLQLLQTLDKQVRNRISSIREQGDRRYDGCMEAWFASR
ncbi:uncharacterized protein LOC110230943 [Arabidopsis lyrata subsp. lyrata]|uniref:uncharacterized protein LOC110230943 n=1 Tax=Arabidopsis lyrata subsp. lyrata TaxID=81972 RepID=UPI000A29CD5B|nr:uncharacterized protein LOC110230943 [Arabidopsis lyrata subsp. lyrata]|eukprot:XP_020890956.1 uncharacterized protein LOC110230943 [Arabidopsis lyrata subsp. lyrata]